MATKRIIMNTVLIGEIEIADLKPSGIKWTAATAGAAFNRRKSFSLAEDGQMRKFIVSRGAEGGVMPQIVLDSKGNEVMAANGSGKLLKKIYNVLATNEDAVARLQPVFDAAVDAEIAGDVETAASLYNYWLNRTSISFNVLSTSSLFNTDLSGEEIQAPLKVVTTDNGSLLTLDEKLIKVVAASHGRNAATLATNPFAAAAKRIAAAKGTTIPEGEEMTA